MKMVHVTITIITSVMLPAFLYAQSSSTITYYDKYGMEKGRAEIKSNESPYQPAQLPEYKSGIPLDMIMKVGEQKQKLYDERLLWIQRKVDNIGYDINRLFRKYPDSHKLYFGELEKIVGKLNTGKYDLSITSVFSPISSQLNNLHNNVMIAYEDLSTRQNNQSTTSNEPSLVTEQSFKAYSFYYSNLKTAPMSYIGKDKLDVRMAIRNEQGFDEGVTMYGSNWLSFNVDKDVSVAFFFDSTNHCYKGFIQSPTNHRPYILKELSIAYSRIDNKTWIDKSNNMKWTVDEDLDEESNITSLIVRFRHPSKTDKKDE